jgi:hypothetical protein
MDALRESAGLGGPPRDARPAEAQHASDLPIAPAAKPATLFGHAVVHSAIVPHQRPNDQLTER